MIATEHAHERAEARAEAYHLDLAKQIASVQRDQKAIAAKVEHMATELGGAVARLDTVADIQGEDPDDSRGVPGSGMRGQLAEMVQLAKGTRRTLAVLAAIAGGGGIAEALRLLGG